MKASRIIYLSAAMLLAGCSAEQTSEQDGALLPIVLGSTVADAPLTRAANDLNNTYLTAGQQVTVRISPTGENNYTDYTYTTAAGGVMNPPAENKPYYPMTGNVDIRAYHPASAATGSSAATFSVAADQTENDAYIASDLLWADTDNEDNPLTNLAKTASTRTLKFQHKLSKITVNATPDGEKVTTITGITLNNVKRKVTFDPSTGATALADTDNDPTTVTMSNNGSAIIPAQDISGTFITINTDAGTAVYAVENKEFESGHQYTLNITVNAAAIGTTNTITGWTSEGTVNVQPTVEAVLPDRTPPGVTKVDLGIYVGGAASGKKLLWADRNIGATSETDYGLYFAWGDVIGRSGAVSSGTTAADGYSFSWTNTPYNYGSDVFAATKYNDTDGLTQLENCDDAAYMNWGGKWRMPTKAEMEALAYTRNTDDFGESNTTHWKWEWISDYNGSGHAGYLISYRENTTDNTTINSTIFLPAAGSRNGTSVNNQGLYGNYRSSSLFEHYLGNAYYLYFRSGDWGVRYHYRNHGYSVRAVCEE